jgi:hypothetical protein
LGTLLGSWSVSNFPLFGTTSNFITTIDDIHNVVLKAGGSYYLYVSPADDTTFDVWNITDVLGDRLVFPVGIQENVNLSAFRVLGVGPAVPEPSTWAMMLLGFAGLGLVAYRRRKLPSVIAAR